MGDAKRRKSSVNECVYCGARENLSDEHIIPLGLGGKLTLRKASCKACAVATGKLEQSLLRGHWWSARQYHGIVSGRHKETVPDLKVKLHDADGSFRTATIPLREQTLTLIFEFPTPTIINGKTSYDEPYASSVDAKALGPTPKSVTIDGKRHLVSSTEKIEFPVNFDAGKLARFLAKVAHSYAISRRGLGACHEYFLPEFILGRTVGLLTYVGGKSSSIVGPFLPGGGMHRMMDRKQGEFLSVYIQLFIDGGDAPPIYEVIVGRLQK